jgi:hypothetical protein
VLEHIAAHTPFPGVAVEFPFHLKAPLFDAVSEGEVAYLVRYLVSNGYLTDAGAMREGIRGYVVTPEGWARLEPPTPRWHSWSLLRCYVV